MLWLNVPWENSDNYTIRKPLCDKGKGVFSNAREISVRKIQGGAYKLPKDKACSKNLRCAAITS